MPPEPPADAMPPPDGTVRRAVFLDRDGVINVDHGYVWKPEDLEFTPTAIDGIRAINRSGHLAIVVTNQSGVARGLYTTADVERFHDHMVGRLADHGARIDGFYHCPYHPDGIVPDYAVAHEDRKPGPGMLVRAMRDWSIDPDGSFMIGDKDSDMVAAAAAGIAGFLVASNDCDLAATVAAGLARIHP